MIKQILYFYIVAYVPISFAITLFFIYCNVAFNNANIDDVIDGLRKAQNSAEDLREEHPKYAAYLERVIDYTANGSLLIPIMFIFTISLIPIVRFKLLIEAIKLYDEEEEDDYD